mmetsp:Transcript_11920/g.38037  ORF Transcript_11920/g.38037 Transcript_11920/m.38037 type:complete len:211 (+) Transcript_11920:340-972(+)
MTRAVRCGRAGPARCRMRFAQPTRSGRARCCVPRRRAAPLRARRCWPPAPTSSRRTEPATLHCLSRSCTGMRTLRRRCSLRGQRRGIATRRASTRLRAPRAMATCRCCRCYCRRRGATASLTRCSLQPPRGTSRPARQRRWWLDYFLAAVCEGSHTPLPRLPSRLSSSARSPRRRRSSRTAPPARRRRCYRPFGGAATRRRWRARRRRSS